MFRWVWGGVSLYVVLYISLFVICRLLNSCVICVDVDLRRLCRLGCYMCCVISFVGCLLHYVVCVGGLLFF